MLTRALVLSLVALSAAPLPRGAAAHPHIFVDTELRLIHDAAGRVTAVEVTWTLPTSCSRCFCSRISGWTTTMTAA